MLPTAMKKIVCSLSLLFGFLALGCHSVDEMVTAGLQHTDPDARRRALAVVRHRRDWRQIEAVVHIARHDPLLYLRKKAVTTLGVLRHPRSLESLVTTLHTDTAPIVRQEAAYALANFVPAQSVAPLQQAWRQERHPRVRAGIATALRRVGVQVDE